MGTRSNIGYENPETGKIHTIYCHWDGYVSHNGRILQLYYKTLARVQALVRKGDLSSLDMFYSKPKGHSFENKHKDYCVFYHRDRKEDWERVKPLIHDSFMEMEEYLADSWAEYVYIFKDGKWIYATIPYPKGTPWEWKPLQPEVEKEMNGRKGIPA